MRAAVLMLVGLSLSAGGAEALTAQRDVNCPKDILFPAAKRLVVLRYVAPDGDPASVVTMEDPEAGFLRFRFKEGNYTEDAAVIEVVEADAAQSILRVTMPSDFLGRARLLADEIARNAAHLAAPDTGVDLPSESGRVYDAVMRYVLKTFVASAERREDVISFSMRDAGLIGFVYRDGAFVDPQARAEIVRLGERASRMVITVPSDPSVRGKLLEREVAAAVKADLRLN